MSKPCCGKSMDNSSEKILTDPVCGMQASKGVTIQYRGQTYAFCSDYCKQQFEKDPERYSKT